MGRSTKILEEAQQHCPWLRNNPRWATLTAWARSASAQTIMALLPPNSKVTFFKLVSADIFTILCPTAVDPVNAILSTSGCLARDSPASTQPFNTLTTPGGNPASFMSSHIISPVKGVFSESFMTTVQPAARAGPSFQHCIARGKFHGIMAATTPIGSLTVMPKLLPSTGIVLPCTLVVKVANYLYHLTHIATSIFLACRTGLPLLMDSTSESLSAWSSIRSASLFNSLLRWVASV
mmetsp:Transcript_66285/g.143044  ORF Transcript_66285/g.143044 Transcript_66285/m.143044 type:complete len:236 (-) Transcript_66285:183-890(-)